MKLEQQVVSLELAKKLKELGVKQESLWYWLHQVHTFPSGNTTDGWFVNRGKLYNQEPYETIEDTFSAFTVAELGEMLPKTITPKNRSTKYYQGIHWSEPDKKWCFRYINSRQNKCLEMMFSPTEADARAKMLIYLLENNLLK